MSATMGLPEDLVPAPRRAGHDLDRAELQRCDTFSDFAPAQDRAFFLRGMTDEAWAAAVARWRLECPQEAADIDARLGGPLPGSPLSKPRDALDDADAGA